MTVDQILAVNKFYELASEAPFITSIRTTVKLDGSIIIYVELDEHTREVYWKLADLEMKAVSHNRAVPVSVEVEW